MDASDYYAPDKTRGKTMLLTDEGEVDTQVLRGPHVGLARIAAVIHREASQLTAAECEQIVRWMKSWKFKHQPLPNVNGGRVSAFIQIADTYRNSQEQKDLNWKANEHQIKSDVWIVLTFVFVVTAAISFFLEEVRWKWSVLGIIIALSTYMKSSISSRDAGKAWKEQEQRYLWQCIRAALTVQELNMAGLFETQGAGVKPRVPV